MEASRLREICVFNSGTGVFKWKLTKGKQRTGYVHHSGYRCVNIDGRFCLEHRLAWLYVFGAHAVEMVDHINGVRTDNRICNLREASRTQNARNRRRNMKSKSGFKGVWQDGRSFRSGITVNGKLINLGSYPTPEQAHLAYRAEAVKRHGEFYRSH